MTKAKKRATAEAAPSKPGIPRLPAGLVETARIAPDRRRAERGDHDRRRSERAVVDVAASLGLSSEEGETGRLFDLSVDGCCIELDGSTLAVGDTVWFRVGSVQPWRGEVRWTRDGQVGVAFADPFFPSVFDLIVQMNQPVRMSRAA